MNDLEILNTLKNINSTLDVYLDRLKNLESKGKLSSAYYKQLHKALEQECGCNFCYVLPTEGGCGCDDCDGATSEVVLEDFFQFLSVGYGGLSYQLKFIINGQVAYLDPCFEISSQLNDAYKDVVQVTVDYPNLIIKSISDVTLRVSVSRDSLNVIQCPV